MCVCVPVCEYLCVSFIAGRVWHIKKVDSLATLIFIFWQSTYKLMHRAGDNICHIINLVTILPGRNMYVSMMPVDEWYQESSTNAQRIH